MFGLLLAIAAAQAVLGEPRWLILFAAVYLGFLALFVVRHHSRRRQGLPRATTDRSALGRSLAFARPRQACDPRRRVRRRGVGRFGLVGSFRAQPQQGDALAELLLQAAEALGANPDCELYVVSRSSEDPDTVWVTEVWTSSDAHRLSLEDEGVRELITRARPLIAAPGERFALSPVGGKGLPRTA